jgi:hypothetical protein
VPRPSQFPSRSLPALCRGPQAPFPLRPFCIGSCLGRASVERSKWYSEALATAAGVRKLPSPFVLSALGAARTTAAGVRQLLVSDSCWCPTAAGVRKIAIGLFFRSVLLYIHLKQFMLMFTQSCLENKQKKFFILTQTGYLFA